MRPNSRQSSPLNTITTPILWPRQAKPFFATRTARHYTGAASRHKHPVVRQHSVPPQQEPLPSSTGRGEGERLGKRRQLGAWPPTAPLTAARGAAAHLPPNPIYITPSPHQLYDHTRPNPSPSQAQHYTPQAKSTPTNSTSYLPSRNHFRTAQQEPPPNNTGKGEGRREEERW